MLIQEIVRLHHKKQSPALPELNRLILIKNKQGTFKRMDLSDLTIRSADQNLLMRDLDRCACVLYRLLIGRWPEQGVSFVSEPEWQGISPGTQSFLLRASRREDRRIEEMEAAIGSLIAIWTKPDDKIVDQPTGEEILGWIGKIKRGAKNDPVKYIDYQTLFFVDKAKSGVSKTVEVLSARLDQYKPNMVDLEAVMAEGEFLLWKTPPPEGIPALKRPLVEVLKHSENLPPKEEKTPKPAQYPVRYDELEELEFPDGLPATPRVKIEEVFPCPQPPDENPELFHSIILRGEEKSEDRKESDELLDGLSKQDKAFIQPWLDYALINPRGCWRDLLLMDICDQNEAVQCAISALKSQLARRIVELPYLFTLALEKLSGLDNPDTYADAMAHLEKKYLLPVALEDYISAFQRVI